MRRTLFLIAIPVVLVALGISGLFKPVLAPTAPLAGGETVHAVLFWTQGCAACEQVRTAVLPPLEAQYGSQLQIRQVELSSVEDFDVLYAAAGPGYDLSLDEIGVPFLVIGERALVGSETIARSLPRLVQEGLSAGRVAAPALPGGLAELVERQAAERTANGEDACGLDETACAPLP